MIASLPAVSMTNWAAILLVGLAALQHAAPSASIDRVLRDLAGGRRPLERVRIETECGVDRQLTRAAVFGSGVAIWNDQRQGAIASGDVRALLDLFVRESFAAMPASFGEDEGDKVKMTCVVRFADGDVARTVMQLEHGRQSVALQRLARAVLARARNAAASVPPLASLDEGLQAIAGGRLAVETLRVTLRSGAAGQGGAAASGWVLRLDGRDLEIEPDAGARVVGRLEATTVREIARSLSDAAFASLPVNLASAGYAELSVAILGQEHTVQAQSFAGREPDPVLRDRFTRATAPLLALRDR